MVLFLNHLEYSVTSSLILSVGGRILSTCIFSRITQTAPNLYATDSDETLKNKKGAMEYNNSNSKCHPAILSLHVRKNTTLTEPQNTENHLGLMP